MWIRFWQIIVVLGGLAIIAPIVLFAAMPGDETPAEIALGLLLKGVLWGSVAIVIARHEIRAWRQAIRDRDEKP